MQKTLLNLSAILLLVLGQTGLKAQDALPATGGNASGSGGSVSYSVGQVVYQTHTGTNGSVAEGVQQPYEISVTIGIEEAKGINLMVSAYPNPTTDFLTLRIDEFDLSDLSFQLYDIEGRLLQSEKIKEIEKVIDMGRLASETYFVSILQGAKTVKTFKIVKH
ncbi:MAG: T9SS type A sorting domain-containing protein [Bacteroidota bacterium]